MSETRLSKRLKPADLSRMAADDDHWDDLEQIADHPSAWPELQDWIDHALEVGPLLAGEPPEPPSDWKRGMNTRPPKYQRTVEPNHEPAADRAEPSHPEILAEPGEAEPGVQASEEPADGEPDMEDDGELEDPIEAPKRTMVGLSRTKLLPIAIILTATLSLGAAYGVSSWVSERHAAEQSQQMAEERERTHASRLKARIRIARALLDEVKASPVSGQDTVKEQADALEALLKQATPAIGRLDRMTSSLDEAYDTAMSSRIKSVTEQLKDLTGQAESLKTAPESQDRQRMLELAATWKTRPVTRENLKTAIDDAANLADLVKKTTKAKEEADRQTEEQRQEQQQRAQEPSPAPIPSTPSTGAAVTPQRSTPAYRPAQSTPSAPSVPQQSAPAPSRPDWTVNPDSTDTGAGMPGRDGSL